MKCQNCGKYEARIRDYREYKGQMNSLYVCEYCFQLDDYWFKKVNRQKRLDPKEIVLRQNLIEILSLLIEIIKRDKNLDYIKDELNCLTEIFKNKDKDKIYELICFTKDTLENRVDTLKGGRKLKVFAKL